MTSCSESQSPHLVIYTGEDGQVAASSILAQGNLVCHLSKTDIFSLFDTLLAVYFTFDYKYPKAYFNFLMFLEYILLQKPLKGKKINTVFFKFIKELQVFQ